MARGLGRSCEVCVLEMYTWEGLTSLETLPALNLDLLKTRALDSPGLPSVVHAPTGLPHSTLHIFTHRMGQDPELYMPEGLVGKIQKYRAPRLR